MDFASIKIETYIKDYKSVLRAITSPETWHGFEIRSIFFLFLLVFKSTRRNHPEVQHPRLHHRENLKSHFLFTRVYISDPLNDNPEENGRRQTCLLS
jgi:hypothetical protein